MQTTVNFGIVRIDRDPTGLCRLSVQARHGPGLYFHRSCTDRIGRTGFYRGRPCLPAIFWKWSFNRGRRKSAWGVYDVLNRLVGAKLDCRIVESRDRTFQVRLRKFNARPFAIQLLRHHAGDTRPGKRVDNQVAGIRKHADEVLRYLGREAGRMDFKIVLAAIVLILSARLCICDSKQIGGHGASVVLLELVRDVVS